MPNLDTTKAVAEDLGYTPRHVARLVAAGELRAAMKIEGETGAYLFDPADVAAYKAKRAAEAVDGGDAA